VASCQSEIQSLVRIASGYTLKAKTTKFTKIHEENLIDVPSCDFVSFVVDNPFLAKIGEKWGTQ
jgi:hypothetical protein